MKQGKNSLYIGNQIVSTYTSKSTTFFILIDNYTHGLSILCVSDDPLEGRGPSGYISCSFKSKPFDSSLANGGVHILFDGHNMDLLPLRCS